MQSQEKLNEKNITEKRKVIVKIVKKIKRTTDWDAEKLTSKISHFMFKEFRIMIMLFKKTTHPFRTNWVINARTENIISIKKI